MRFADFKNKLRLFSWLIIILFAWGCSTQKNTPITRTFHNITSKYNYYFNANESYTNAIDRVENSFNYNYTFPLPVLLVGNEQVAGMVAGDMDRAVTKCSDMIRLHSITVKPERSRGTPSPEQVRFYNQNEFVKWVREGWLLVGKARVWKGAYDEARMTFEHILTQFPNTTKWHEAQVWLARIDLFNNDFVATEDRLRNISNNRRYPKDKHFTHLLESTWASFHHKQNNVPQTINHLEKALENAPDRSHRLRYTYLLGQLHQNQKNFAKSNEYFHRATRLGSSYEMSFNARINIASNFQGGTGGQEMVRTLERMARDEKNAEFLDQIYYALGNIARSNENMEKAIEFYKLSAQKSLRNNHQKGLSYLILADYYFDRPNYTTSQAYYDSAYNALDSEFPGYRELEIKTQYLNKLVENLNIVERQDSLLKVAAMSPRERDVIIAELIKKVRDDEERLRQEERDNRDRFAQFQRTQRGRTPESQEGLWYFYNQSLLSNGLSEFNMRWGRRELEDNWRRSNRREMVDATTTIAQEEGEDGAPAKLLDNKSREYYLRNLPLTDSLVEIAHQKIKEALFRVGEVYEKDLVDCPEAKAAYERLAKRYPNSSITLQAYYNLYQISRFTQNAVEKERYKQTIISQFPNSTYALMLSDPQYVERLQREQKEMESFYEETFALYKQGRCRQATVRANEGMEKYADTDLVPKFHFILAQCIGSTGSTRGYKNEMLAIIDQYPDTDIAKRAADIVTAIDRIELQLATTTDDQRIRVDEEFDESIASTVRYQEPEGEHLFLAIIPKGSPINQLRFNLVSFNADHFINLNLNVGHRDLTEYVTVMTVSHFENKEEALEYFNKATQEDGLMGNISPTDYTLSLISRENMKVFLEDKSLSEYLRFFRENY